MEKTKITLGSRVFWVQEEGTIEHDLWTMKIIRDKGLDKLTLDAAESSEAFVQRVLSMILETGALFTILAAGLVPDGQPWTPEGAEEVAGFLKDLREPEDKKLMQHLVVSVLIGFFAAGLPLWTNSRKSSGTPETMVAQNAQSDGQ